MFRLVILSCFDLCRSNSFMKQVFAADYMSVTIFGVYIFEQINKHVCISGHMTCIQ